MNIIKESTKALKLLEEVNNHFPETTPLLNKTNGVVEYDLKNGIGFGFGLLKEVGKIAVCKTVMSSNAYSATHSHPETEYLIIYEGSLQVNFKNTNEDILESHKLEPEDFLIIEPNILHDASAITDVKLIAITIPDSMGFPDNNDKNKS